MKSMRQIITVHGGEAFDTYDQFIKFLRTKEFSLEDLGKKGWKSSLQAELGETYQVISPQMPNGWNAKYKEWEIWFDKVMNVVGDDLILIGHSLGGIFLVKYLAMHDLGKRIRATLLVAPVFEATPEESVADFALPSSLEKMAVQAGEIHIFHSTDDLVVPYTHTEKYVAVLPQAKLHTFSDRQHFNQPAFPEIIEVLRSV